MRGGRNAVWRGEFSVCASTWSTSLLLWRLQEGNSTIVGTEQTAVVEREVQVWQAWNLTLLFVEPRQVSEGAHDPGFNWPQCHQGGLFIGSILVAHSYEKVTTKLPSRFSVSILHIFVKCITESPKNKWKNNWRRMSQNETEGLWVIQSHDFNQILLLPTSAS